MKQLEQAWFEGDKSYFRTASGDNPIRPKQDEDKRNDAGAADVEERTSKIEGRII